MRAWKQNRCNIQNDNRELTCQFTFRNGSRARVYKSSDSRAYISPPSDGGGGLERRQKKNASLSDFDAKTMRAKESTRTGRVQSTTNDWTFLDPFFAAGAIFMFDFFLSVSDEILRVKMCCCFDGAERET